MNITFATCDRARAKGYIKRFYPQGFRECPELEAVLDLVEADIIRIPDPDMHPNGAVYPGKKSPGTVAPETVAALQKLHAAFQQGEAA